MVGIPKTHRLIEPGHIDKKMQKPTEASKFDKSMPRYLSSPKDALVPWIIKSYGRHPRSTL